MITDAFDGFSFFGRFGFAGSVGLAAPHALHRFADALLSSVHCAQAHSAAAPLEQQIRVLFRLAPETIRLVRRGLSLLECTQASHLA